MNTLKVCNTIFQHILKYILNDMRWYSSVLYTVIAHVFNTFYNIHIMRTKYEFGKLDMTCGVPQGSILGLVLFSQNTFFV